MGDGDGQPLGRQVAAGDEGDAGSDFERTGSADVDEAGDAGLGDGVDEVLGDGDEFADAFGGERRCIGADDCVGSGDSGGYFGGGGDASLLDSEAGLGREFCGAADDGGTWWPRERSSVRMRLPVFPVAP